VIEQCRRTTKVLFVFLVSYTLDIAKGAVDHQGLVLEQSCLVDKLTVTLFVHMITAQQRSIDFGGKMLL
jgi:hypothetical protein